ncbi:MAG: polymerase subunit sigma-24 [Verrucomicrobiales bacterium]|nr:polymerase subunit sigma-24 [Verrucomicrobiales bacterium]
MEPSDFELMARLAKGDDLALNALMDRWGERVTAFLFRMTGNRDTAVDLAQETFVKLYQAKNRYRPGGNFPTYLFAISGNLARNHARWNRRHPTVSLDAPREEPSICPQPIDPGRNPLEAAEAMETTLAVDRAFQTLPDDLREAMVLFIYEGMSHAEIASMIGCSPKAVETRIYRARQLLKERLKDLAN